MFAPGTALNQQNIGQTIRPSSTALLTIDSEDRFANYIEKRNAIYGGANYSPYDFTITKNQAIMNGFFTRLAVSEISFPWVIPNINVRTASIKIVYQVGAGNPTTFTLLPSSKFTSGGLNGEYLLPVGFYRPSALASRLSTIMTYVCGFTVNVSYGFDVNSTGPLTTTNQPVFQFRTTNVANKIAFLPMDYNSSNYPYPSTTRQLYDLLGMDEYNVFLQPNQYTNPTFCQAIKYIDIVCPQLVYNQSLKDASSSTIVQDSLCRLYLANADNGSNQILTSTDISGSSTSIFSPPGTVPTTLYRNFNTPKYIAWIPNQPVSGQLHFQIYDDQGQVLDPDLLFENGYESSAPPTPMDWTMTLLVSEN